MAFDDRRDGAFDALEDDGFESDRDGFRSMLAAGADDVLRESLENAELLPVIAEDPRYAELALSGVVVLAWSDIEAAGHCLSRFSDPVREHGLTDALLQAEASLLAAAEWRSLPVERPDALERFLALGPVVDSDRREELQQALLDDVESRPELYLALLDHVARTCPALVDRMIALTAPQEAEDAQRHELDEEKFEVELRSPELEEEQVAAIGDAISDVRATLSSKPHRMFVWLLPAVPVALAPSLFGLIAGGAIAAVLLVKGEGHSYEELVRPRLARLAAERGIGPGHLLSWIYGRNNKVGRLARYDIKIENDHGLAMLALFGRSRRR